MDHQASPAVPREDGGTQEAWMSLVVMMMTMPAGRVTRSITHGNMFMLQPAPLTSWIPGGEKKKGK